MTPFLTDMPTGSDAATGKARAGLRKDAGEATKSAPAGQSFGAVVERGKAQAKGETDAGTAKTAEENRDPTAAEAQNADAGPAEAAPVRRQSETAVLAGMLTGAAEGGDAAVAGTTPVIDGDAIVPASSRTSETLPPPSLSKDKPVVYRYVHGLTPGDTPVIKGDQGIDFDAEAAARGVLSAGEATPEESAVDAALRALASAGQGEGEGEAGPRPAPAQPATTPLAATLAPVEAEAADPIPASARLAEAAAPVGLTDAGLRRRGLLDAAQAQAQNEAPDAPPPARQGIERAGQTYTIAASQTYSAATPQNAATATAAATAQYSAATPDTVTLATLQTAPAAIMSQAAAVPLPFAALLNPSKPQAMGDMMADIETGLLSRGSDAPAESRFSAPVIARPMTAQGTDVLQEIVRAAMATKGNSSIELRLDPSELGSLDIELSFVEERVAVTIRADREEALDMMRRSSEDLAKMLREAGVDLGTLTFAQGDAEERTSEEGFAALSVESTTVEAGSAPLQSAPDRLSTRLDIRI